MGAGEPGDHRPFQKTNGMGIPGSGGRSERIYCRILQRTLEQGGCYQFKTQLSSSTGDQIKLHMAQYFLPVLMLFIIISSANKSVEPSATLNAFGFDLIGTRCNDPY